jgi:hypothetical protein
MVCASAIGAARTIDATRSAAGSRSSRAGCCEATVDRRGANNKSDAAGTAIERIDVAFRAQRRHDR